MKSLNKKIVAVSFLLLFGNLLVLQSQNSDFIISKTLYTNIDGLPSREITCVTQDNHGYIWFGTRNGLCRFDGNKFLVFNTTNSSLYYNNIQSIYFDKQDGIIINFNSKTGYYPGQVNQLQVISTKSLHIKQFDDYYVNRPFNGTQVSEIALTSTNDLIFRLHPFDHNNLCNSDNYETFTLTRNHRFKQIDSHIIKTISFKKKGLTQNVLIEKGTNRLKYNECAFLINSQNETIHNSSYKLNVFKLYEDEGGEIFGCEDLQKKQFYFHISRNDSILKLEKNKKYKNHLFDKNFNYLHIIGTDFTLEIDNKSIWRLVHLSKPDLILVDSLDEDVFKRAKILQAYKDNLNNYWFCTTEGIVKINIKQNNFEKHLTLKQFPEIVNHSTRGIFKINNEIFVSMPDAVVIENSKGIKTISNSRNFGIIKNQHNLLIGGGNTIVVKNLISNKNQIHSFLDLGEIWSLLPLDTNNIIAFGTEKIVKYNIITKTQQLIQNNCNERPNACYRVVPEKNGGYLLVGESGVFMLNKNNVIYNCFNTDSTNKQFYLPIQHINDIHIDKKDNDIYWLATAYDGLYKWDRHLYKFTKYGLPNGFLSETCYRIEEDNFNNLWVSTDYGIAKFNKQTQDAIVYTENDGVAHNEFNRASSYVDENGLMYFGGIDGYTVFNPEKFINIQKEITPLVVTKITSFNIENNTEVNELPDYWLNHRLTLTKNKKNLTLNIALLDYETRQHQYGYQIKGFNNQWQYTTEGKIIINGLPYGNYVLLIKVQNVNGKWLSENMIKIPFEVLRPYNETWWFYSLIVLFVILLIALVFYFIYRSKVKNLKRLSDLRLSIASDLHDQVGGLLNKTAIQSELMQSKQKEKNETLTKIAMNNRTALSSMRDIIWNLDPRNDNSESLADRMNDYAHKMLADDFDYTINIQEIVDVQLNHEIRQNLNMIFKEAINNIVKHAPNSHVKIELGIIHKCLVLTIFNSGDSQLPEKRSGQGLLNMEMRAKKIKGKFTISFDKGVEICVTVPASH